MPTTDWVQLDTVRTREPYKLRAGVNSNRGHSHGDFGDAHDGPIDYEEWEVEVLAEAFDTSMASNSGSPAIDQQASFVRDERWLTTPGSNFFSDAIYSAAMHITGSVTHVHDFDPLDEWIVEASIAAAEEFDADPPPGVTFRYLEWETNPYIIANQPWGSSSNRSLEVTLSVLENEAFDRDGGALTAPTTLLEHSVLSVPNEFADPADTWRYGWDAVFGMWDSGIANNGFGRTWFEVVDDLTLVGGGSETFTVNLDTAWSGAWDIQTNSGSYRTKALPLVIAPEFAISQTDPFGGEQHVRLASTAELWFESDWTPPRYRFVYTTTPVAPVLRHYPRDGDGRGWGGVTRGYPPPRGRRGYGGARQP
jgi:hypothetical protein